MREENRDARLQGMEETGSLSRAVSSDDLKNALKTLEDQLEITKSKVGQLEVGLLFAIFMLLLHDETKVIVSQIGEF